MAVVFVNKMVGEKVLVDFEREEIAPFATMEHIGCEGYVENDKISMYGTYSFGSELGKKILQGILDGEWVQPDFTENVEKALGLDKKNFISFFQNSFTGKGVVIDWEKGIWAPVGNLRAKPVDEYHWFHPLNHVITRVVFGGFGEGSTVEELIRSGELVFQDKTCL